MNVQTYPISLSVTKLKRLVFDPVSKLMMFQWSFLCLEKKCILLDGASQSRGLSLLSTVQYKEFILICQCLIVFHIRRGLSDILLLILIIYVFLVKLQLGCKQQNKYNEDRNKPKQVCSQQGGDWWIHPQFCTWEMLRTPTAFWPLTSCVCMFVCVCGQMQVCLCLCV